MKLMTNGRKLLLAGVALTACLGFAFNAQAQTCTITNWTGTPTSLSDADAGTQGSSNRRYGGPCGLRVGVDGSPHHVTDPSPSSETTYIARFYTFLNNAGSDPVQIFAADDGASDQIQVWYNSPTAGDLTLRVFDTTPSANDLTFSSVGAGWHSVELVWEQAASANILFSVDGAADAAATVDTTGISIANAHLGNVDGAATGGGSIDFDDFDSRRVERPGRLMVGDANDDLTINSQDFVTVINEISGVTFASGQPDCNEDGVINSQDFVCVINIISGT